MAGEAVSHIATGPKCARQVTLGDWLAQNPVALREELRDQQADARWSNKRTHGVVPEDDDVLPALPKKKPGRGRRSSGTQGATVIASGSVPASKDARHVERANHEEFIAKVAQEAQDFYTALRKNVHREDLDVALCKVREYFDFDAADKNVTHPLRDTHLIREAKRVARKVRELVHMKPERGKPPSKKITRLQGTRIRISCGGEPTRTWTDRTTHLTPGVNAKRGSPMGIGDRLLPSSVDLLDPAFLDILYFGAPAAAHKAACAFASALVGRSPDGVADVCRRVRTRAKYPPAQ